MADTNLLKKPVEFHRRRFLLGVSAVVAILVILALRGENTRTQVGNLKGNIANRCVAGADASRGSQARQEADNACRKLLSRLLEVSKGPQQRLIIRVIKRAVQNGAPLQVSVGGKQSGPVTVGPSPQHQSPPPTTKPGDSGGGTATVTVPGTPTVPGTTVTTPKLPTLPIVPKLPRPICVINPVTQQPVCINNIN